MTNQVLSMLYVPGCEALYMTNLYPAFIWAECFSFCILYVELGSCSDGNRDIK